MKRKTSLFQKGTMLDLSKIDDKWTLFLDRDGVINHEKYKDYVYHYEEFVFYEGALEALGILGDIFSRIILVTNQRGVGRGLMTEESLIDLQTKMIDEIKTHGGRIDSLYYCTSVDDEDPNRKPNPGMAFQAVKDNPEINLSKSIMVGNNLSDMAFGRNAGMYTVFLTTTQPDIQKPHSLIDLYFSSLREFGEHMKKQHSEYRN
jgi:D-glycero-D-manno-heptose 1,7-bisphosphate phosphatase